MIWVVFLTPIFLSTLFFSHDIGRFYESEGIHQTAVDSLALTGINVVRRVFYRDTAAPIMTPTEKANAMVAAIMDAAANMDTPIDCQDITITYCPKATEPADANFNGGGPCFQPEFSSGCNSPPSSYETVANPSAFYPLPSEMTVNPALEAAYLHISIASHPQTFFSRILTTLNFPAWPVSAMARAVEEPGPCGGYFSNFKLKNDPQTIRFLDNSQFIVNGGILILSDPNLVFSNAGSGNEVDASWIESVGTNANDQIYFCCDECCECDACPRLGVDPAEVEPYIPNEPTFDSNIDPCSNPAYFDTAANPCDTYKVGDRLFFINCEVTGTNYTSIITNMNAQGLDCAGGLCPGTYCGGITISSVPDAANLVMNPVISGGTITDNVYYFVQRDGKNAALKAVDESGATYYNQLRAGYIRITNSFLEGADGNLANYDGGVYLYAPEASGSGFSLNMAGSDLRGSMLLWASHTQLDDSVLSYSPYTEGENVCTPKVELITYLVL